MFIKLKTIITLTLILFSVVLEGQNSATNGAIEGVVTDKKTGETIVGANILIQGTTTGKSTDIMGNFLFADLKQGTYNLVISFISYKSEIISVEVSKGKTTQVKVALEEVSTEIKGVVISATRKTDSEISMVSTIKNSDLIVSGLSNQQIKKSQDKDAGEVIRRVPGITIQGSRFVVIRGLNQRYNVVWLNGAATPSSETDVKAFSFDMIPSALIENILVYKTPAPELPGDFAGATIQIFTKSLPEKNSYSFNYSASYRSKSTFKEYFTYQGGKTDWLGFDDGTRQLPDGFPEYHLNEIPKSQEGKALRTDVGRMLNKIWEPYSTKAFNDNRFSLNLDLKFRIKKTVLNNITSINYSNTFESRDVFRANYFSYDTINDLSDTAYYFNEQQYSDNARLGILHNWALIFGNNQIIEFRNFYNHSGNSKSIISNGKDFTGGSTVRSMELDYVERSIYSGQLGGKHKLKDDKIKLDWTLSYSFAGKDQPDVRRITYVLNDDINSENFGKYGLNVNFAANTDLNGRIYMYMKENIYTGAINYEHLLKIGNFKPVIKAGIYAENKNRLFNARLLGFAIAKTSTFDWSLPFKPISEIFADSNINSTTGLKIDEQTNDNDSYSAENFVIAAYLGLKIPITSRILLYTGLRVEQSNFFLKTGSETEPIKVKNDTLNYFPSANLTYSINEKSLIRLAYGMTINRPEFREIAPFNFFVYDLKAFYSGNTSLKNAYIHNFDLRYEFYPSLSEMITVGAFYKNFINPIEATMYAAGSGWNYTFTNAESANSIGAEIDLRKSFNNLSKKSSWIKCFKDFTLVMNASYIYSAVKIPYEYADGKKRPMQGQSPYIVNVGVFYQNDTIGLQASLMYNIIGKRIAYVGNVTDPHTWEMSRNLLDFTITKKFGKWFNVKFAVNDILNQKIVFKQFEYVNVDSDKNGQADNKVIREQETRIYKPGTYYTLGIGISF